MRSLNSYITEKFQVGKDYKRQYMYTPKDKDELIKCIIKKIEKEGLGTKRTPLDLNDIDTSEITDMSYLFDTVEGKLRKFSEYGNFDISDWDVSNVKDMYDMFYGSEFNGDISDWNVSKGTNVFGIFDECPLQDNPPKWYHKR